MQMNGALIVNKPAGMTSHDVVARVRRLAQERSVGHLGTLDPMATGVLALVLGKLTRLAQFYCDAEKEYHGTIRLGLATDTYDAEGQRSGNELPVNVSLEEIRRVAAHFTGKIQQIPPPFSAKKVKGVPAYKLARREQPIELKPVEVHVKGFEILGWAVGTPRQVSGPTSDNEHYVKYPEAEIDRSRVRHLVAFKVTVSAGTYVRSLAHDLGKKLGVGAHLASLERTRSGEFTLGQAYTLDELERLAASDQFHTALIQPRLLLPTFPSVMASEEQMARIRHGNAVNLPDFSPARLIKVFGPGQELAAIATRVAGTLFQPKIVLV